jgi:hypothetical protein
LYRDGRAFSPLGWRRALLLRREGRRELVESSVTEIHGYPRRPPGFEAPLYPTRESKREIMAHFLEAPWLSRASELSHGVGESAHAAREPVRLVGARGRVVKVLECWREVRVWWDDKTHTDRLIFRVLLAGGAVAELALECSGEWFLVGMAD